ncbi:MAG: glycoside hydrolase family 2 TIM barrel-domain containing protein [Petrimonas sp.]|nr:glycoside hydrolase family 2 TIM barrel-domain containing protein [Petrimonas sp.]
MKKLLLLTLLYLSLFPILTIKINANSFNMEPGYTLDASSLEWRLWGYRPNVWRMNFNFEKLEGSWAEYANIPINIPGSVQLALKNANIIEDWNMGVNSTKIEWIENRHWLIGAKIPSEKLSAQENEKVIIEFLGLDYKGIVMVNGQEAGKFDNMFIPHRFDITPFIKENNNNIVLIFECPPENLGQIGWTSKITEWKSRFNYGWDWMPRIVQTGIWDKVFFHKIKDNQPLFNNLKVFTEANKSKNIGKLSISLELNNTALRKHLQISLTSTDGKVVFEDSFSTDQLEFNKVWDDLKIERWWPNELGPQNLYNLHVNLIDENRNLLQQTTKRIGFRHVEWTKSQNAPIDAEPWICNINSQPIFLQGINWTPIRPNFADLQFDDYAKLLHLYKDLGINTIRIWGGGFPEKEWLYDLCDELGILIWQDFPLSSSGLENYPPEDLKAVHEMTQIVNHYVKRLHHHASLLLWCGGNELYELGDTAPVTHKHIMIKSIKEVLMLQDPTRRFLTGSPSGPNIYGNLNNFGTGKNWDVHGPWDLPYTETDRTMSAVKEYWDRDDAMFRSEVGVPGAMSAETMNKYKGQFQLLPASMENPLWRSVSWWIQWEEYLKSGRSVDNLNEYIEWSQNRQMEGLVLALKKSKERFPTCGGFIIWMGHDSYPCMINTSLIDFEGNPKPVVDELSKIWKDNSYLKKYLRE